MDELAKIYRVIGRELPDSSVETLLVLDAATGKTPLTRRASFQALQILQELFLTKLDGTAKGRYNSSYKERDWAYR